MELLAVRTARFIAAISIEELNPRGLAIYQSLVEGLTDKYNFSIPPNEDEPYDETKGITFEDGEWNGFAIDKITIFPDGIVIETRSSTADSEAIFDEAIVWASESLGLTYKPEMVTRRVYISELIFRTDVALNNLNPILQQFSEKISNAVKRETGFAYNFEPSGILFHYDASETKTSVTPFRIERLDNTAYSANKYYSIAPLHTEEHLKLLEEFEAILSKS